MFPSGFKSFDGLNLWCYGVQPPSLARGRVIVVHGLGDHGRSLPYRNLSEALCAQGFATYGFDLRGHGQSEGPRMYAEAWISLRDDLRRFVDLVRQEDLNPPLFLVGLSLGGLLVLNYAQHHAQGLSGVVAVAPALDASGVPPMIKAMMPLLSRLLPRVPINPGLDLAGITRDPVAAKEYTADPGFQTRTTPRLATEALRAMEETWAGASSLSLPLLILHGEADAIVRPEGSADFFARVGSTDKQRLTYPDAYHNLFLESNRAQVFADIGGWLERHS